MIGLIAVAVVLGALLVLCVVGELRASNDIRKRGRVVANERDYARRYNAACPECGKTGAEHVMSDPCCPQREAL